MWMASHELLRGFRQNIAERELPVLFRDRCLQDDMQKQISELVPEPGQVIVIQRFHHFVRLLDERITERAVCLGTVPRALFAEPPHDADVPVKLLSGDGGISLLLCGSAFHAWFLGSKANIGNRRRSCKPPCFSGYSMVIITCERP
jgi:hypothetical protein